MYNSLKRRVNLKKRFFLVFTGVLLCWTLIWLLFDDTSSSKLLDQSNEPKNQSRNLDFLMTYQNFKHFRWTVNPSQTVFSTHEHFLDGQIAHLTQFNARTKYTSPKMIFLYGLAERADRFMSRGVRQTATFSPDGNNNNNENDGERRRIAKCYGVSPVWRRHFHRIRRAVQLVNATLFRSGITYYLAQGSYLGSYRYHSVIPWDDDVDFQVDRRYKPRVVQLMQRLAADPTNEMRFKDTELTNGGHMKLGVVCTDKRSASYLDCYFQIDVFFFTVTPSGRVKIAEIPRGLHYSTLFPTVLRPFMGFLLPTPFNYSRYRRDSINFDSAQEISRYGPRTHRNVSNIAQRTQPKSPDIHIDYCHRAQRTNIMLECIKSTPCQLLSHMYPTMHRQTYESISLFFGGNEHRRVRKHFPVHILSEVTTFHDHILSYFIQIEMK